MTSMGLLIVLGMVALYAGPAWLVVLVPAAFLVWRGSRPLLANTQH